MTTTQQSDEGFYSQVRQEKISHTAILLNVLAIAYTYAYAHYVIIALPENVYIRSEKHRAVK